MRASHEVHIPCNQFVIILLIVLLHVLPPVM